MESEVEYVTNSTSESSPWSEIISKYLNGTAERQLIDHRDLVDFGHASRCRENEDNHCRHGGVDGELCHRRHHHRSKHRHHHDHYKHHLGSKKRDHRRIHTSSSPLENSHTNSTNIKNNNNIPRCVVQTQCETVNLLAAQGPSRLVWADSAGMAGSLPPPPAMYFPANNPHHQHILPPPTPCYLALPISGPPMPGPDMFPVVVPAASISPFQYTQNQVGSEEPYLSESSQCPNLTESTCADVGSKEEDLLFARHMEEDIFGDANDLESAEEAEEQYQQLYETERRRSRTISERSLNRLT